MSDARVGWVEVEPTRHWLVVEDLPDSDDQHVTIECSGSNGTCWAFEQCEDHKIPRRVREAHEGTIHGVHHRKVYFGWVVDTGTCSLDKRFREAWGDSAADLAARLGPGRHEVDWDWTDEYTIELTSVPEEGEVA